MWQDISAGVLLAIMLLLAGKLAGEVVGLWWHLRRMRKRPQQTGDGDA